MDVVEIGKVKKILKKVPFEVGIKFQQWVIFVEEKGIFDAQKFPGFEIIV